MCTMVSTLVSGRTLHDFARGLQLEHYLALNADDQWAMRGMSGYAGGMLADAFEALLGALFMDRGYPAARAFLLRLVEVCTPPLLLQSFLCCSGIENACKKLPVPVVCEQHSIASEVDACCN